MLNNLFRKGLTFSVIFLFVGVGIATIINGNNGISRGIKTGDIILSNISSKFDVPQLITSFNNGSLSGYVTDTLMNPVEGTRVRVYFHETYEEDYTDSAGSYNVNNIPICFCLKNCTASKKGYKTERILLAIDENTTYDFVLTPSDKTLYVGGDNPGNYSKIQDAIHNASDGDTIYVYSGMYFENVIVDKSIELIGENKDTTFIDGSGLKTLFITSNSVKVNGFTIQNTNKDYPDNCRGICIYSNDVIIYDNIINNNEHGIVLANSSNIQIYDNYFIDNNWAIITMSSNNVVISNNIVNFNENEDGYVHHCGMTIYESTGFSISNNVINSDDGLTLSMEFISDTNIFQNRITGSFCGIILRGSNNVTISENAIENNRHGIELSTSADVEIIRNNFIGNKLNAFFSKSIIWDVKLQFPIYSKNIWDCNYWDRSRLFPYPIFGGMGWVRPTDDFVYHPITWITFDLHPAKEPYDI